MSGDRTTVRWHGSSGFLAGLLLLPLLACHSPASLLITVYRNQAVYFAGDSLSTGLNGRKNSRVSKIVQLSDTCCVGATGINEAIVTNAATARSEVMFSIPADLAKLCEEFKGTADSLAARTNRVVTECNRKYQVWVDRLLTDGADRRALERLISLELQFAGYDPSRKVFFSYGVTIQGTNSPAAWKRFELDENAISTSLGLQGETGFLSAMIYGHDEKLTKLCPRDLRKDIQELPFVPSPLTDERMTECLLEMFRVHQKNAARLHFDPGQIGEPYVIYRISRDKILRLH